MESRWKNWKKPPILENKPNKYNWIVQHKEGFKMGTQIDIGQFTYINAVNGVTIEDFVQIGSHCSIYSKSTIDNTSGRVILKKNCKIGTHSVVMPGVVVGENSVVGACSFVKESIPPNCIAYGVPAKVVGRV